MRVRPRRQWTKYEREARISRARAQSRKMPLLRRLLLFVAAGIFATALPARADDTSTIRVLAVPIDLYAQAYYAADLGLFKAAGLDVEVTTLANGGVTATALAGGSGDIAVSNLVQVATAISRGVPLTVIAGAGLYSTRAPSTAICVTKASPLHSARDLEGKTIAVAALNDQSTIALKKWLAENGADYRKVRMIELGYPEMIAGLSAGRIDAAMLAEPWQTTARSGDDRLYAKPFDSIAPEFNIGVWATTRAWAQAHPDLAKRFAGAIYAAAKWANTHHPESALILAKYAKADPKVIGGMIRVVHSTDLTVAHVQPPLDAAFAFQQLDRHMSASELIWDPTAK
jgi:NitT/TauT family transport system substrate-binding protein